MNTFKSCVPCVCNSSDRKWVRRTQYLHYVSKWLLSRPFDLILSMCNQLTKLGQMVLKGINSVIWSWKKSTGYTMIKLGDMVLKGVNWVDNDKIESNGLFMTISPNWSFVYIRKTYIDQSPKPQNVQILKMHAFYWNACILCKLDENAGKCAHFLQKTLPSRVTLICWIMLPTDL